MVPARSDVSSRFDVDLATADGIGTTIPIVVANMTAVAGRRMAETVARRGGLAILPQDIPVEVVAEVVSWVKQRHLVVDTALTLGPASPVGDALALLPKRAHGAVVVVDAAQRPVGIVTEADTLGADRFAQLHQVMSRALLTLPDTAAPQQAFERLDAANRKLAPVVDGAGRLVGVLTRTAALRATVYRPALDAAGRLRVGRGDRRERRRQGQGGAAARGRRGRPRRRHRARPPAADASTRWPRCGPSPPTCRSSPATWCRPTGVRDLVDRRRRHRQGRRGPGRHVHHPDDDRRRPSAVLRRARVRCRCRAEVGAHVWADGGVRHPRDVALALAAGASSVMIGSWFAGTYESPGDLHTAADGRQYKESFGMASARAVAQPHQRRGRLRARSQGTVRGGDLVGPDVPRPAASGRRGPAGRDHRRRPLGVHVRRGAHARGVRGAGARSACRARRATPRAGRCSPAGSRPGTSAAPGVPVLPVLRPSVSRSSSACGDGGRQDQRHSRSSR